MVSIKLDNNGNIVVNNYTTSIKVSSGESAGSIDAKVKKAAALAKKNGKISDTDMKILFAQSGKFAKQLEGQAKKGGKAVEKEKPEKKEKKEKPPAKKKEKPPAKKKEKPPAKEKKTPPKKGKEEKAAVPPVPTFGGKKKEEEKKEKKAPPKPVPIKPTKETAEETLNYLSKKDADKLIEELEKYEAIVADLKIYNYAKIFKHYKQIHDSGALTKEDQKKFEAFKKEIDKTVTKIQKAEEAKKTEETKKAAKKEKEIPVPKINWDMQLPSTLAVVKKAKGKMDSEIMKFGKFFWNLGDYVGENKKSLAIRVFNEFYQLPEFKAFVLSTACDDSNVENLMVHLNENKGKVSEKTSEKSLETATGVLGGYLTKIAAINTPYKSETKHIGGIGKDMNSNMLLSSLLYLRRWYLIDKKKEAPILLIELQKEAPTAKKTEPMKH